MQDACLLTMKITCLNCTILPDIANNLLLTVKRKHAQQIENPFENLQNKINSKSLIYITKRRNSMKQKKKNEVEEKKN